MIVEQQLTYTVITGVLDIAIFAGTSEAFQCGCVIVTSSTTRGALDTVTLSIHSITGLTLSPVTLRSATAEPAVVWALYINEV